MMQSSELAETQGHYVLPDQLRVGLYVHVDLPWFAHPFRLNRFKISSEEQIADLRALNLERFRYDPARSDALPQQEAPAAAEPAPADRDAQHRDIASDDPLAAEQREREQHLSEHRHAIAQTERGFIKAANAVRSITRNVLSQPEQASREIEQLIDMMAPAFLDQRHVSLHVMGERCGGEEAYLHGLNVFILSMMLAKELGIAGERAHALGVGALLHDIGQIEIPDRVLMKNPEERSAPERTLYASHVERGLKLGRSLTLAPEALAILAEHHELADGSGYPRKLTLERMASLARVVSLTNRYDNLCNPVDVRKALSPHEALSYIYVRCRDQFDAHMLQIMIRTLGVYPPGSIVRLTNNVIAMVMSVNLRKSLRPWVVLYEPDASRDEATMLDLEREPELRIAGFLRPAELDPEVFAFLSPRKRITYFFDQETPDDESAA